MSPKRNPRHSKPVSVPRSRSQNAAQRQRQNSSAPAPSYAGVTGDVASAVSEELPEQSRLKGLVLFRWLGSWQFVLLTTLAILTGTLAFAVTSLFRMPNLPNCRAIFWPTASAAMRLQCAESYAGQGSVDFLLEAIALVEKLPDDHPLRAEINAKVEIWSRQILELANEKFHRGEFEDAIATAKKIPANTTVADQVETRINRWQRIWKEGSETFEEAKEKLVDGNFKDAFGLSVRLLDINNDYWSKTKYNELTKLIGLAREDSRKIGKVKRLISRGTVKSFKEAIKLLASVKPESVLFKDAQELKKTAAKDMLRVAENALARQDLSQAEAILATIPRDQGLNEEIADFQVFTEAYRRAWSGDALGLDSAITRLQSLGQDRPLYGRAQTLIGRWREEIKALAQLDTARQIAAQGNVSDLRSAIFQARQVSTNNPRWDEVSDQIEQWESRIQTTEDQPMLVRADQLARLGTPDALREAIQEARKINPDRALGDDAQARISRWQDRIEAIEDRPLVDEARQLAAAGDLAGAIAIASRIAPDRSLYNEVQNDLDSWRAQEKNRNLMRDANSRARSGNATDLASAIATANQVSSGSAQYPNALQQINRWSWDLLSLAESESRSSLDSAMRLAEQIPSQAEAYTRAQNNIQAWRAELEAAQQPPLELAPAPAPQEFSDTIPAIDGDPDDPSFPE